MTLHTSEDGVFASRFDNDEWRSPFIRRGVMASQRGKFMNNSEVGVKKGRVAVHAAPLCRRHSPIYMTTSPVAVKKVDTPTTHAVGFLTEISVKYFCSKTQKFPQLSQTNSLI